MIGENGPLGTWLVSTAIDEPQRFEFDGRSFWMAMRPERVYRPYSMQLIKFTTTSGILASKSESIRESRPTEKSANQ